MENASNINSNNIPTTKETLSVNIKQIKRKLFFIGKGWVISKGFYIPIICIELRNYRFFTLIS